MWQWVIVGVLYAFGMGFFSRPGGVSSAGEALRRWGESACTGRQRAISSS